MIDLKTWLALPAVVLSAALIGCNGPVETDTADETGAAAGDIDNDGINETIEEPAPPITGAEGGPGMGAMSGPAPAATTEPLGTESVDATPADEEPLGTGPAAVPVNPPSTGGETAAPSVTEEPAEPTEGAAAPEGGAEETPEGGDETSGGAAPEPQA